MKKRKAKKAPRGGCPPPKEFKNISIGYEVGDRPDPDDPHPEVPGPWKIFAHYDKPSDRESAYGDEPVRRVSIDLSTRVLLEAIGKKLAREAAEVTPEQALEAIQALKTIRLFLLSESSS